MADELDIDLDQLDQEQERANKVEQRIKDLSHKVKTTATERDELAKLKAELELRAQSAEKERDFFKGFSDVAAKYKDATEYKDKILEKVNAGYEVEDATISVLHKEGKFQPQAEAPMPKESPAGGSAINTIKSGDVKAPSEMSLEEKRAALMEAEQKGDLSFH